MRLRVPGRIQSFTPPWRLPRENESPGSNTTPTSSPGNDPSSFDVANGAGKINGSYNLGLGDDPDNRTGGVTLLSDTVESNFDGFTAVVDALGGLEVDVPEAPGVPDR